MFSTVFRIRAYWTRIRTVINCTDPDPDRINKQKNKEKLWFLPFVDFLMTCFFEYGTDINVRTESDKQKNLKKILIFVVILKSLTKRAGSGAGSGSVIKCTDPRFRIRTNMSRIRNIGFLASKTNFFFQVPLSLLRRLAISEADWLTPTESQKFWLFFNTT